MIILSDTALNSNVRSWPQIGASSPNVQSPAEKVKKRKCENPIKGHKLLTSFSEKDFALRNQLLVARPLNKLVIILTKSKETFRQTLLYVYRRRREYVIKKYTKRCQKKNKDKLKETEDCEGPSCSGDIDDDGPPHKKVSSCVDNLRDI